MKTKVMLEFWTWFFRGSGDVAGWKRLFLNRWIIVHLGIGLGLGYLVTANLTTCANTVLLPLIGIFVGLSFAWAGNAQALLQTSEMEELANHKTGGFEDYVYTYQMAILTILACLVLWAFAGLSIFDERWPTKNCPTAYFGVKTMLFTVSSMTLRECWHVVLGAQWMLIVQKEIRKINRDKAARSSAEHKNEQQ